VLFGPIEDIGFVAERFTDRPGVLAFPAIKSFVQHMQKTQNLDEVGHDEFSGELGILHLG
jgi:hypothetical protein